MTRAPPAAASSRVRSVECESTTMISSQKSTERRHASMRSASLKVMMHAVRPLSFATGTSASPGDNSPYNTQSHEPGPVLRPRVPTALRHSHTAYAGDGWHRVDAGARRGCARRVGDAAQPHARLGAL